MKHLYYHSDNRLHLENVDLAALGKELSSPFYIYSKNEILRNCQKVKTIAGDLNFMPCYAIKANYNPRILELIQETGFGADVVSGGELHFALKCGFPAEKVVFAGVGKTRAEIVAAVSAGIHSLNIESESELEQVAAVAAELNKEVLISVRVNPDIDAKTHPYISTGLLANKFGVTRETARNMYLRASRLPNIVPAGIHVHIGSQIETAGPYIETIDFINEFIKELAAAGINIRYVDLGGGIGIDYHNQLHSSGFPQTHIDAILPQVLDPFRGRDLNVLLELGRSIIGSAGLLITKVLYIKQTPLKKFIVVDAAMNNLMRPSLYQAYHQIVPLVQSDRKPEKVDVVGPVCETTDFFARDRMLPELKEGDMIAITGAGAYGQSLASNYNLRPMLAEYLVSEDRYQTIFKGETIDAIENKYTV
ncbi:MAG: diaminopimelate decarboxylase [Calditrichales bacterium]|nr:MAG: diaminopimelate decarboxylase [Calditrichales bacterium]